MVARTPGYADKAQNQAQFQTRRVVEFLQREPFLRRQTIEDISVSTTPKEVRHALGYVPQAYLVVRSNAAISVYDAGLTNEVITLVGSGTGVVSIMLW